jgi:iron-sulfur cluster assembly accessory protein
MISITDFALQKLKEIAASEGVEEQYVRIKLKGGGCSGMMHEMDFVSEKLDTDELIQFDTIKVIIDPVSFQYLENVSVDYIDSLMSTGFKFNSPDIKSSCGCGKSISY